MGNLRNDGTGWMDAAMRQIEVSSFHLSKFPVSIETVPARFDLTIEEAQELSTKLIHAIAEAIAFQQVQEMKNEERTS